MLVTCPECGSRISSEAESCPQCGLPNAGERSKEYCEYMAKNHDNDKEVTVKLDECTNPECDFGYKGHATGIVKKEIRKLAVGYEVIFWCKCPRCGKPAYRRL